MVFNEEKAGVKVYEKMREIDSRTYFNRVPVDTSFPYAVFNILDAFQQEGSKTSFMLEVDIWDNKGNDISDLLELQSKIQVGFHKLMCNYDELSLSFALESTLQLDDNEQQIRRRQLRFLATYYNKEI